MKTISSLPFEIQLKILSYTYSPQCRALCLDIQSFVAVKAELMLDYNDSRYKKSDVMAWMLNDLCVYWNRSQPILYYGFHPAFVRLVMRHERFCNRCKQDAYIYLLKNFKKNSMDTNFAKEINFIWGLMVHEERKDFLEIFIDIQPPIIEPL
jgi:hypothetical protein